MSKPEYMQATLPLMFVLLFAACVSSKDKAIALAAIDQYHHRFNDFRFHEIYDDSTETLKASMSEQEFLESIHAMRRGQGTVIKSQCIGLDYRYADGNTNIKLLMLVTFEKGDAKEEFIFRISQGRALMSGYKFLGA